MTKKRRGAPKKMQNPQLLWEESKWDDLAQLDPKTMADQKDPATSALFIAAAHFHLGNTSSMKTALRQATDWGASQSDITEILSGTLHNTLGRIALLMEDRDQAWDFFQASVEPILAGDVLEKKAFVRQFHEAVSLGLLPEAAKALTEQTTAATSNPTTEPAWATILDSKIEILNHVISLSLKRGQLSSSTSTPDPDEDPRAFAEQNSVSQLGQDVWVLEQCDFKQGGFFVEFGATNGILLSNSYALEKTFGWSGICAEPNPGFFADLQINRECVTSSDCISGETGKTVRFVTADEYGGFEDHLLADMNSEKRQAYLDSGKVLELETISLNDFLLKHDAPKEIDYLSIDTEGSEYEILAAFPFEDWHIRFITVEHNFTPMREEIFALLQSKGYVRTETRWDDWYAYEGTPSSS